MVVQRSPPPLRRSPRKEASASEASFSSFSSHTSQARKIGKLPNSTPSAASRAEPATPVQHAAASDFPSLDQMAAVSKEQRSAGRPTNRAAFTASFPASSSNTVPSSLPRPVHTHRIQLDSDSDDNQRPRAARSSLTNGAIQRVRQQAGDETPLGVSQARAAARQAAMVASSSSSKAKSPLLSDDSGDTTAQLLPGRRDATVNPIHADIDVENPQMPSLSQPAASTSTQTSSQNNVAATAPAGADTAADASTASQASIFGTANRRNGRDQPIGTAAAGTAYDFSKYLDGELDPFNRASRANPRRESRPLPAQHPSGDDNDDDDAETSGDTTARGTLAASSHSHPTTAPVESTPLVSRVKAMSAATPRMSPHASPSVSSRKLAHLSSLSNGHSTPTAGNTAPSAAGDASTASLAHRYDPSARTDRLQNMELGELRKKYAVLSRELALAQDALVSAKEESEGWASECSGLQEQLTSLKNTQQAALARESRARAELQVRLSQYKIEADDRAWKLLAQRRQTCLVDVALQHAKNEATYHEGRYHSTESELEGQKDELRIRLMLERKRADLLALHVKAALRDGARLKKRLSARSAALLELQAENEKLAEQLEDARHSRRTAPAEDQHEAAALRQQLEEAQAEIETLNERDAMMAETRKTWKAERKQLLAQVEQLSSTAATVTKAQPPAEALRPVKTTKPAAAQMLPPSSPVYAKKQKPMQGASELEPLSEDDFERRVVGATTARKANTAKTTSPLVPFAQISSKAAPDKKVAKPTKASTTTKSKSSKNWRDEVAITDSSEEDSDEDRRRRDRKRDRRAADASDSADESDDGARAKTKSSKPKSSTTKRASTKASGAKISKANKPKPAMPIEYDDQTADPSATPIIRSSKRNIDDEDSDDDQRAADSSVLGAKFGRDRTNFTLPAPKAKGAKTAQSGATAAGDGQVKKKKRKLLGGVGGALQWGGAGGNGASEAAGLAPNFDIPLELSPIKGGGGGRGGAAAGFLAGFGLPSRNPFA